jgi:hypothetical protein
MSVRIGVDYGPVDRLRALLRGADRRIRTDTRQAVETTAKQIQRDWRRAWSGHPHIPHLPAAIQIEIKTIALRGIEAKVGINKAMKQGPFGHIIEFGSVNNGPLPGGLHAAQTALPTFRRAIENAMDPLR